MLRNQGYPGCGPTTKKERNGRTVKKKKKPRVPLSNTGGFLVSTWTVQRKPMYYNLHNSPGGPSPHLQLAVLLKPHFCQNTSKTRPTKRRFKTCPRQVPNMSKTYLEMNPDMSIKIAMIMHTLGTWEGITWHTPGIKPGLSAPEPEAGPQGYLGCVVPYISHIPKTS